MSTHIDELQNIITLAALDPKAHDINGLLNDVNAIMHYVEQLRKIDTSDIPPLLHPLDVCQPLRSDNVTETSCTTALEEIAPVFVDNLYLVPKVIDTERTA